MADPRYRAEDDDRASLQGQYDHSAGGYLGNGGNGTFDLYTDQGLAERDAQGQGAGAFLIGDLNGATSRYQHAREQRQADERLRWWMDLNAPTADQLAQRYDYDARGGREGLLAQTSALDQLGRWSRGGLTDADRGMMESTRMRDAQASASQRQAIMQQMQARGMGGSGSDLASQMMASQMGQQQASDAESQMMQSAQQRALSATQAQAQLGGQMRALSQHETETQQDAYNRAIQQSYEDATSRAQGANNAQTGAAQGQRWADEQQAQGNQRTGSFLSGLIDTIGSAVTS